MQLAFLKQAVPDCIQVGDEIELFNCEDHHLNSQYAVLMLEPDGTVTLADKLRAGHVLAITMDLEAP